jgi:hypothetical protein
MKDMVGNEYIVECEKSSTGFIETNIKSYSNKELVNEQVGRIFELMEYKKGNGMNESVRSFKQTENEDCNNIFKTTRKK